MTTTTCTATVMSYATGERLCTVALDKTDADQYAAGTHPGYQWPEGLADARDVLSAGQIAELDVHPETVIFLEV
jgi:hypothetical protein